MTDNAINPQIRAFIEAVTESGQIWALSAGDDWVVVDSAEFADTDALPLFSSESAAKAICHDEWADYQPAAIPVSEFFDTWLESLSEDEVMVGIDWNADLEGAEIDPFDLAKLMADKEV
ncbi:DUF2750 domain-containing protein [Ferrimonas balearica]|uniref:DUF2750 domain-containing protein n=1 Tax=Ferrimonas balearica TaxID=44012 RepID=UPI001C994307|nr:DUF2750 domain-containing protein [Ferrimonas balearica]MBY5920490.1 DUF2750 domain-containing protein [Ferrimonas balearica]MBY5996825.1 DUF2750 domain-containing protein [Ferrimonas balearica]